MRESRARERVAGRFDEHRVAVAEEPVPARPPRADMPRSTRSRPANAHTSISSVDSGRWKLVTSASTTRKRWPGRMKSRVSPSNGASRPGGRGRLERAHARGSDGHDPAAAAPGRRDPAQTEAGTRISSPCMRCASRSSVRTGWNVPAPTCSVRCVAAMPAAVQRVEQAGVEMQARRGRRHRAWDARIDRLVALPVDLLGVAMRGMAATAFRRVARRPRAHCRRT